MCLLQYSVAISEISNKITVNSAKYVIGTIKDKRISSPGQPGCKDEPVVVGTGVGGGGGRIDANTNVNSSSEPIGESSYRKRNFCHLFYPNSR